MEATVMEARTEPQHMQALAHANRVRLTRAALKRKIQAGKLTPADVLRDVPWEAETMTIGDLLRSQVRWGRTRVRKFLTNLAVNENREVGRLSDRQRRLLAEELERPPKR